MANIRINALPSEASPLGTDVVPIDGASTRKTTLTALVTAGRPLANQAEAEAGSDAVKAMTPLTTKQSIASEVGVSVASAAEGNLASTAVQPARTISTGTGLTGGGDLSADRTLALDSASIASLALADSAIQAADMAAYAAPIAQAVPVGGTTGQALLKQSNANNDVAWQTLPGGGDMLSTNNLGDVASIPTARQNLGISVSPPQGRLTLTSATPVTSGDVTAAGTVYYTPHHGNRIPIYNGTYFAMREFAELSQAATDTTKSPSATAADKNYDVFVWDDAGTLRLSRGPAWTTDTGRATFITSVGGMMLNAAGITNGPATERGTWVGTIRSTGASQFEDSTVKRFVWNAYNRVIKNLKRLEGTDSWSYSTATLRQANNSTANQVAFVTGAAEDAIEVTAQSTFLNSTATERNCTVSIGLDSTSATAADATPARFGGTSAGVSATSVKYAGMPTPGYHFLAWLEAGAGADTQTWHGDNGQPSLQQNGILGRCSA